MTLRLKYRLATAVVLAALWTPTLGWAQSGPNPKLIEGAKKEGHLVYYTTMTLDQSKQTVDLFE